MVQAILRGDKTMTRRVIKPLWRIRPPHKPGDVLYVRERVGRGCMGGWVYYADVPDGASEDVKKLYPTLSIHMPREAARIFLRVTDARAERLQDITTADAIAEGVRDVPYTPRMRYGDDLTIGQACFAFLWDSFNAKRGGGQYAWDKNPWVWAYRFEKLKGTETEKS
jgi:hypothetical protein